MVKCNFEGELCLLITHEKLHNHPPFGMTSRRISVTCKEYVVHTLMREVERGDLTGFSCVEEVVDMLCKKYSTTSQKVNSALELVKLIMIAIKISLDLI